MSKSGYQISVAVIERDANVNVLQPPATLEDRHTAMAKAESKTCTVLHRKLILCFPTKTTLVVSQAKQLKK